MKKFDVPEIPHESVIKAKLKLRKVWALEDLNLHDPAIYIDWKDDQDDNLTGLSEMGHPSKRMVEDPEFDLTRQLRLAKRSVERLTAGDGFCNLPAINLLHFGTGPLATAFGSTLVLREGSQPAFEPVVHTPEEVLRLKKPNLLKDGMCEQILERIEYYNEATQGKIPIQPCDTAGPWSIATQIWHYEDILEALYTAPEVVHGFLNLVTECMIEFIHIQMEIIGRNACSYNHCGDMWFPHGWHLGDDTMVTVSPRQFQEFYMPYNERISREFGGVRYHCCMKHEHQLENMTNTKGFMGYDANPDYNNIDLIEKYLTGKGAWARHTAELPYIDRFRGKVGLFLHVDGNSKQDALDHACQLREHLERTSRKE